MSGPAVFDVVSKGSRLPDILARVAEECGLQAAFALAQTFGGRQLYMPRPENLGEHHPISVALGFACARKVAGVLGSGTMIIPLGPAGTAVRRRELVRGLKAAGKSNGFVAQALGVHLRTVERYLQADRGPAPEQWDLFDTD